MTVLVVVACAYVGLGVLLGLSIWDDHDDAGW